MSTCLVAYGVEMRQPLRAADQMCGGFVMIIHVPY
jgi:hypothetical protein